MGKGVAGPLSDALHTYALSRALTATHAAHSALADALLCDPRRWQRSYVLALARFNCFFFPSKNGDDFLMHARTPDITNNSPSLRSTLGSLSLLSGK